MSKILSVFPYYGGKYALAESLVDCVRLAEAEIYVEPYLGGGRTFLNLNDDEFKQSVINELNRNIFNLWHTVVEEKLADQLLDKLRGLTVSKDEFNRICHELDNNKGLDTVTSAAYTYYAIVNSRNAAMRSYSKENASRYINRCDSLEDKISLIPSCNVRLSNKNALDIIEEYIKLPNAVLFLDPPYWEKELVAKVVYKENEATSTAHHTKLIDLLCSDECKAKVILCGYYRQTPETKTGEHIYDKLLEHNYYQWYFKENVKGSSNIGTKATEYIWTNFSLD